MPWSYYSLTHDILYETNRRFSNISGFMKTYGSDSGGRSDRLFVSVLRGCLATSSGVEWMKDVCVKGRLYDSLLSSTRSAQRCGISRRFRRAFHWRRTAAHEPRWFYYLGTPDHVFIFLFHFHIFKVSTISLPRWLAFAISLQTLASIQPRCDFRNFWRQGDPPYSWFQSIAQRRGLSIYSEGTMHKYSPSLFSFRIEALRRFTDNWEPLRFKSFCLQIISFR